MSKRSILWCLLFAALSSSAQPTTESSLQSLLSVSEQTAMPKNLTESQALSLPPSQHVANFQTNLSAMDGRKTDNVLNGFKPSLKVGGYLAARATYTDREEAASNSNLGGIRLIRLYATGYVYPEVFYMLQGQLHNAPGDPPGPSILDAFVEWQASKAFHLRLGQYPVPFGFENAHSLFDLNYSAVTQGLTKLIEFQDRVGQHVAYGRDMGAMALGSLFPQTDGHHLLSYRIGLFGGQGMNHNDRNNHKDLMGGFWIAPTRTFRVGFYGWNGRYVNEKYDATNPNHQKEVKRQRWLIGAEYDNKKLWVRSEYISSNSGVSNNVNAPTLSDALYAEVGYPILPKTRLNLRWDGYRDNRAWNSLVQQYQMVINYYFTRNLYAQIEYYHTVDKIARQSGKDWRYNTLGLHVYCRF